MHLKVKAWVKLSTKVRNVTSITKHCPKGVRGWINVICYIFPVYNAYQVFVQAAPECFTLCQNRSSQCYSQVIQHGADRFVLNFSNMWFCFLVGSWEDFWKHWLTYFVFSLTEHSRLITKIHSGKNFCCKCKNACVGGWLYANVSIRCNNISESVIASRCIRRKHVY